LSVADQFPSRYSHATWPNRRSIGRRFVIFTNRLWTTSTIIPCSVDCAAEPSIGSGQVLAITYSSHHNSRFLSCHTSMETVRKHSIVDSLTDLTGDMAAAVSRQLQRPLKSLQSATGWKIARWFTLARSSTESQTRWWTLRSTFGQWHPFRGPVTPPQTPRRQNKLHTLYCKRFDLRGG
jgi:hypothetical protein